MHLIKNRFLLLLIILGFQGIELNAAWQSIENPFHEQDLRIVSILDINNIWIRLDNSNLVNFHDGKWDQIYPPPHPDNSAVNYSIVDSTPYAAIISGISYESTFYEYSQDAWQHINYQSGVPVRYFTSDHSGGAWGFGDWATLFHYKDGIVKEFESPIDTHILSALSYNSDSLWLGTRNSGVFLHTSDGMFTQYFDSTWIGQDVITLFDPNPHGISCILSDGRIFQIKDQSIAPLSLAKAPIRIARAYRNSGNNIFYGMSFDNEMYHLVESTWQHKLNYPPHQIRSLTADSAGVLYYSGDKGLLIRMQTQSGLHFHNIADIVSVEGSSSGNTVGAAFLNLDKDQDLDLFVLNYDHFYPPRLYRNHGGSLFSDISFGAGLLNIHDPLAFTPGDFDQDGSADLAIVYQSELDHNLDILFQIDEIPLLKHTQSIRKLDIDRAPAQLLLSDPDFDKDPDIFLISFKSTGSHPGTIRLIENDLGLKLVEQDSAFQAFGSSWFKGITEISSMDQAEKTYYMSKFWSADEVVQINSDGSTKNSTGLNLADSLRTDTYGIAQGDYDNDGDMDIFRTAKGEVLQIFENNDGIFVQRDHQLLAQEDSAKYKGQYVNLADFNNDGFIDIFLTSISRTSKRNFLLLNIGGQGFQESQSNPGLNRPAIIGSCFGDIEGDGDIDIFGFRRGTNQLWINDHDSSNFVLIKQTGSSGFHPNNSSYALFYESGQIGDSSAILGRRQSRASNSNPLAFNASDIHFGMGNHKLVDLILFSSHGQVIEYRNVAAGTTLILPEYVGIKAYPYAMMTFIKRIVNTPRIALGLLGLMINLFGQYYFMRYMRKRYEWSEIVVHGSGTINLTFFFILFYLSDFGGIWVTFILPLGVAQSLNLGILLLHLGYDELTQRLDKPEKDITPLQKVMIFAHGEWALKNINSLILYFQNYDTASKSKLSERIVERVETFLDLTLPAINELLFDTSDDDELHSSMGDIKSDLELLRNDLLAFQGNQNSWEGDARVLSNRLSNLLKTIRIFKQDIYIQYSSNPHFIVKQLIRTMEEDFNKQEIKVELLFDLPEGEAALISQNDLTAIMDNCIRNACRALSGQNRKILRIRLFEFAPRFRIQIIDTGSGVGADVAERIFEPGWSGSGGSGLGLFQAREILKKYAATIKLDPSYDQGLTTFTIDLHKGVR